MKKNIIKLVVFMGILILLSSVSMFAQLQNSGKGKVIAVRFLELKADVDTTEFEKFALEAFNPSSDATLPGLKLYIAKSDRGKNIGSYALFHIFDSQIVRDLIFPKEGNWPDWISKISEDHNVTSNWNKLKTYVVDGSLQNFNDFVVLR